MHPTQRPELQNSAAPASTRMVCSQQSHRCQILAKKGFLTRRHITNDLVLLVHSREFQLGVLLHLPLNDRVSGDGVQLDAFTEDQTFTHSVLAMISAEFQSLGVRKKDLAVHLIGGAAADEATAEAVLTIRRILRGHGLTVSAHDLGGAQARSVWMDVESGRVIVRSKAICQSARELDCPLQVAS